MTMNKAAPAARTYLAALLGLALLAGCSTQQAGTPVPGAPTAAPTGSASSPSSPATTSPSRSTQAPATPTPTTLPSTSDTVPTGSDTPATGGPIASSTEPTGPTATATTVQAKNPECGDYREMVLSFEISEDRITDYRWWLTLTPGAKAKFDLETGDSMQTWGYDVPADLERDVALCDAVAGNGNGSGDPVDGKRAAIEITLADGDNGRAAVNDEMIADFEQLVLDELPVVLVEKVNADLAAWQEQQGSGTSTAPPGPSGGQTTVETTGGGADSDDPCRTSLGSGSIVFSNGETDPATYYEWELLYDAEQGSMTMTVGPPKARETRTVDFALPAGGGADLCSMSYLAVFDGSATGTDGPAATVTVDYSDPELRDPPTTPVGKPVALQDKVLTVVPQEAWGELWQFYSDWSVAQSGG